MNKTTIGFKVRKNDQHVIHRNQRRFIPNYTQRVVLCTMGGFYTI